MDISFRTMFGKYIRNTLNSLSVRNILYGNNLSREALNYGFNLYDRRSSIYLENASFLRLDNVSLTYKWNILPERYSIDISLVAQNPLLFTGYTGPNPEIITESAAYIYPYASTYSLQVGFRF